MNIFKAGSCTESSYIMHTPYVTNVVAAEVSLRSLHRNVVLISNIKQKNFICIVNRLIVVTILMIITMDFFK